MKTNCQRCNGEMVTIQTEADAQVKTRFCCKCGLIENYFTNPAIVRLLQVAVKAEDLKGGK